MPRPPLRLKRREQFLAVARDGRKFNSPGFTLQARWRDDRGPVRLGLTATRKLGNAVARNRARRRLGEAARLVLAERQRTGLDLVLIGRPATASLPFERLRAELSSAIDLLSQSAGAVR